MEDNDFITADFLVAELLGDTYDEGGLLQEKFYRWIFRVWNDISLDFIKPTRKMIIPVSQNLKIALLPPDFYDWVFIGYFDNCRNRRPLAGNRNLAPRMGVEDKRIKKCTTCGSIDLCQTLVFDESYEVVYLGDTRTARHITRLIKPDGSYTEEIEEPTAVYKDGQMTGVTTVKHDRTVCNLTPSTCGCVPATTANIQMLMACGCSSDLLCCSNDLLPYPVASDLAGSFNIFKEEGFIQLSADSSLDSLYIEYISTGICKRNTMYFPSAAMNTLIDGAYSLSIQKKRGISGLDKQIADRNYMRNLKLLARRLSRIDMQSAIEIFQAPPRIPSL